MDRQLLPGPHFQHDIFQVGVEGMSFDLGVSTSH